MFQRELSNEIFRLNFREERRGSSRRTRVVVFIGAEKFLSGPMSPTYIGVAVAVGQGVGSSVGTGVGETVGSSVGVGVGQTVGVSVGV